MLAPVALRRPVTPFAPLHMPHVPAPMQRIVRWGLAGGGSLVLQLLVQGLLIDLLAVPARWAIVIAYEVGLVAHFFVNERWVFAAHGRVGAWRRFVAFHASALGAEALTMGVALVTLAAIAAPVARVAPPSFAAYIATVAGVGAATVLTFSTSFFWIWRRSSAVVYDTALRDSCRRRR